MVVAMTHENGNVGKHFGHAKEFKLYEIEDSKIVDQAVVGTYGEGHEAQVMLMNDYNVSFLICDSIGECAMDGLKESEITYLPGINGKCDDLINEFINGQLIVTSQGGCSACGGHDGGHSCCSGDNAGCSGPGSCCGH